MRPGRNGEPPWCSLHGEHARVGPFPELAAFDAQVRPVAHGVSDSGPVKSDVPRVSEHAMSVARHPHPEGGPIPVSLGEASL